LAASSSPPQHSLQQVNLKQSFAAAEDNEISVGPFDSVKGFDDLPSHPPKPILCNQFQKMYSVEEA
jgi:hypothetical protein